MTLECFYTELILFLYWIYILFIITFTTVKSFILFYFKKDLLFQRILEENFDNATKVEN